MDSECVIRLKFKIEPKLDRVELEDRIQKASTLEDFVDIISKYMYMEVTSSSWRCKDDSLELNRNGYILTFQRGGAKE